MDIFALGIVGIEMSDGSVPNKGKQKLELRDYYTNNAIKPEDPSKWSAEFNDFLSQALAVDPKKRATAEALLKHPFITSSVRVISFKPPKRVV